MIETGEVKLHFLDYWRVIKMRAGLITLVFLLVMVTAGVTTYFLPRRYLAKVTMEVRQENVKIGPTIGEQGRPYDPQFVTTQFQILRKSEILYPVIEKLDLIKSYSGDGPRLTEQQTFNLLQSSLDFQEVRNTDLIELGVWNTDREMAANVANTIAVEYRNQRISHLQDTVKRGLEQFEVEVNNLRKQVEEASVLAAQIRTKEGIIDPDPESSIALPQAEVYSNNMEKAVADQRVKVAQVRTALDEIQNLKPEALKEALKQFGIDDPNVANNLSELQHSRVDETTLLNSGLGENNPRVKATRAKIQTLTTILSESLDGIRRAEAAKLRLEESTLTSLEENLKHATEGAVKARNGDMGYVEAKTKYLQARRLLDQAEGRLSSARIDRGIDTDPIHIWQRAEPPLGAEWPPVKQYLIAAAFIGLMIGVLLAFFIEYLDTSVKTIDDVERFLQTTVLAVIPKNIPILLKLRAEHPDSEAYRILRTNLEFNKPAGAKSLTIVSAGPGEGKSTTLNNLAFTCAKGGDKVLVIDADLRRPSQHLFFDTDNSVGLTDYVLGKATLDSIIRPSKLENLSFVPSGLLPPDTTSLLTGHAIAQLLNQIKGQYDFIFVDSPPILGVSDGSVIASEMDMNVMVVQHRRFPRAMLQRVKHAVQQVGGALVGVVLNNVDSRHDDGYAYYNAYQDYYAHPNRGDQSPRPTRGSPRPNQQQQRARRPVPPPPATVPQRNGGGNPEY